MRRLIAIIMILAFEVQAHAVQMLYTTGDLIVQPIGTGMLTPSGMDSDDLRTGLLYDLKDLADAFVEAEQKTGVNAVWLSAIAALESGWGRSELAQEKHNLFGWTNGTGYAEFDSAESCIFSVSYSLMTNYLSDDGCYYIGKEIEDVAKHYNPMHCGEWAEVVREIHDGIQGRVFAE